MNKSIFIIALCVVAGAVAYTFLQKNEVVDTEEPIEATVEPLEVITAIKHAEFEDFWIDFQKLMTQKNTTELNKMIGKMEADSPDKFYLSYIPLEPAFFDSLNSTKASDVKDSKDFLPTQCKEFGWEEVFIDDEGTEFESATYFYFSKVDGVWRIVFVSLAG